MDKSLIIFNKYRMKKFQGSLRNKKEDSITYAKANFVLRDILELSAFGTPFPGTQLLLMIFKEHVKSYSLTCSQLLWNTFSNIRNKLFII